MTKIDRKRHSIHSTSYPSNQGKELEDMLSLSELKVKDYAAISENLLKKGAFSLLNRDPRGLDFFDMAIKLAPSNANMHFEQGLSLFEYGSEKGNEKLNAHIHLI